jgi:hypothetical protein
MSCTHGHDCPGVHDIQYHDYRHDMQYDAAPGTNAW